MVFFGGFGSMLPYLIYLSIVWVCVLVGMRGNIASFFRQTNDTELIVEDKSQNEFLEENTIAPFSEDQTICNNSDFSSDIVFVTHCPQINVSAKRLSLFKHSIDPLAAHSISHRGPPNQFFLS